MISNAFKGAYTNEVAAEHKVAGNIQAGIRDAASVATVAALGFSGAISSTSIAKFAAGRVGGIGGSLMMATMNEKVASSNAREEASQVFTTEEVNQTVKSQLGDNPINRAALKKLNTVFDTLVQAREEKIIKNGKIKSDLGDIDPNSELGKKVLAELQGGGNR